MYWDSLRKQSTCCTRNQNLAKWPLFLLLERYKFWSVYHSSNIFPFKTTECWYWSQMLIAFNYKGKLCPVINHSKEHFNNSRSYRLDKRLKKLLERPTSLITNIAFKSWHTAGEPTASAQTTPITQVMPSTSTFWRKTEGWRGDDEVVPSRLQGSICEKVLVLQPWDCLIRLYASLMYNYTFT